jgi:hypothetical protein
MKRTLTIISAALLTSALASPLMAQAPPPPINTNYGEHHENVEGFDSYLDAHPEEQKQLSRHPELIDDPKYLEKHPDLHGYMQANPEEAKAFKNHPYRFEHREHVYTRSERRFEKHHHEPVEKHP